MSWADDHWTVMNTRTGRRATIVSYRSRAWAELEVLAWRERQRRGGRPDISFEKVQELRVVPLRVAPWRDTGPGS